MSVEIGPKACISVARGHMWQGHASCLKKTKLVGSSEVSTSLNQCSGSPVYNDECLRLHSKVMKNVHLACDEAFDVQPKNSGSSELVGNVPEKGSFILALHHPEKNICRLVDPH